MVKKKIVKEEKKGKKAKAEDDEDELDSGESEEELSSDIEIAEEEIKKLGKVINGLDEAKKVNVKASKPISELAKGDKVKVDGLELEVDAHYILMDHGKTKEMAIELFNPKTDKDYQLRYFSDQVDTSLEFYELQEILYVKKGCDRVEW